MASFPALIPSSRTFTPGDYPNSPFTALSGLEGRVRHSNVVLGSRLTLGFRSISESDMLAILAHYQAQHGQYAPFNIPSSLLNGVSAAGDYTLEGYQWRYVNPPSVTDIPCAGYDVSIELQSVGGVGAFVISTLRPNVQLSLAPGVAAATNGIVADIGFALDSSGAGSNGANLAVTASYADNGATGEGFAAGIEQSIVMSIQIRVSGDGSESNPWRIYDFEDLELLRTHNSGDYFRLENDIDCEDTNWTPVASFNGYIDGNWKRIKNFRCTGAGTHNALIGSQGGSAVIEIRRLGIEGATGVTGSSTQYQAYFLAVQTGANVLIEDCYCNGPINNGGDRGGNIMGLTQNNTSTFRRVWSGANRGGTAQGTRTGGIVYQFTGSRSYQGAYFLNLGLTGGGAISRTTAQSQDAANFPEFDFVNHWKIGANGPEFQ